MIAEDKTSKAKPDIKRQAKSHVLDNSELAPNKVDPSQYQPYWFKQALTEQPIDVPMSLTGLKTADICIVGGGYTGLWSAIKIKQKSPEKSVVVLEKGLCGQGASGRNGGCMLTFSTKFFTLKRLFGEAKAIELIQQSEQAVFAIERFCQQHQIDAQVRVDGTLYTATNTAQQGSLQPTFAELSRLGINAWQTRTPEQVRQLAGSNKPIEGAYSAAAGSVQPAKLVLGLARVAQAMGVEIYQHSPMVKFEQGSKVRVVTDQGEVLANKLILALNAWTPQHIKAFKRSIVLVSSDMMITEPMPEQLAKAGLTHGMPIVDSRIFVHYYRTTPDGRLMLGKGGNLFAFANHMLKQFDQASGYQDVLNQAYADLFPQLPCKVATTWNGASDRSATGLPFFGHLDDNQQVMYGLGYSGNGIVQSYLGGEILSSMALELDDQWRSSALISGCLGQFPPEPIRTLGAYTVRNAVRRKERMEDHGQSPFWLDKQLAKFAAAAGKADKA